MFLCRPCKEALGAEGLLRSWGSCEMCDRTGTYCFDIPASRLPKAREEIAPMVIEELFTLARERRLLAATHETEELAAQNSELDRAIRAVSPDLLPMLVRHLVIMVNQMSDSMVHWG